MSWTNRVVWDEGMFLRPQHFQQMDRAVDGLVRGVTRALRPNPWGLIEITLDRDLLAAGRFAVASAAGVFEDGTPFSIPADADHPKPLDLGEDTRDALVYLAVPVRQPGAAEVARGDGGGRYEPRAFEAYDTHSGSPQPAELGVGRLRLRYVLQGDDLAGYHAIPLARVAEVTPDRRAVLDDRWIPPALLCSAAPQLTNILRGLGGLMAQRAEPLAARLSSAAGAQGMAEISDLLLLQAINGWQKLVNHWADAGAVHPGDLYAALVQMAGELATYAEPSRRPNVYPPYRHEDLQRSLRPVIDDLRRYLAHVSDPGAVAIPLQLRRDRLRVGMLNDRGLLRGSRFVLTVQADMPTEILRRLFPSQVKIGAVEYINELVNSAVRGLDAVPMPAAPRQIPFYAGAVYFELQRGGPHWAQMQNSGGFGLHVSGDFPNLRMELWAILNTQEAAR